MPDTAGPHMDYTMVSRVGLEVSDGGGIGAHCWVVSRRLDTLPGHLTLQTVRRAVMGPVERDPDYDFRALWLIHATGLGMEETAGKTREWGSGVLLVLQASGLGMEAAVEEDLEYENRVLQALHATDLGTEVAVERSWETDFLYAIHATDLAMEVAVEKDREFGFRVLHNLHASGPGMEAVAFPNRQ